MLNSSRPPNGLNSAKCRLWLQICLHLHFHLLPFTLFAQLACFWLKFSHLHPTYRVLLMALHLVSSLVQLARPYLGYAGNLGMKMPELAGFWILTALLHLPSQLFLSLNPDIRPLPLERYTILLDILFSIMELVNATLLIRQLAQRQMELFRQFAAAQQQKQMEAAVKDGEEILQK